jgi:hypothetical protein
LNIRSKIFWLMWFLIVIGVIFWFARMASAATPSVPGKKKVVRKTSEVKAGDGALLLITHPAVIIPPNPILTRYYFAATASNESLESNFSNEVVFTNQFRSGTKSITLAWDRSEGATSYAIYKGHESGAYSISYPAGTNLFLTVALLWPILSNVVITVTTTGATNLFKAVNPSGPWTALNRTNWITNNPTSREFFRSVGKTSNRVFISETM